MIKLTKWQKITALIMLIGGALYIGYDIFIVNKEPSATLSRIMLIMIKFPLIIYAWFLLGGHFISPFNLKWRSIPIVAISGAAMLVLSILSVMGILIFNSLVICIMCLVGFFVGAICWNQKAGRDYEQTR